MSRISNIVNSPGVDIGKAAIETVENPEENSQFDRAVPRVFIKKRFKGFIPVQKVGEQRSVLIIPENNDWKLPADLRPNCNFPLPTLRQAINSDSQQHYNHLSSKMERAQSEKGSIASRSFGRLGTSLPPALFIPNVPGSHSIPRSVGRQDIKEEEIIMEVDEATIKAEIEKSRNNCKSVETVMKAAQELIDKDNNKVNEKFQKIFLRIMDLNGKITNELAHWPMHRLSVKKRSVVSEGNSPTSSPPQLYSPRNKHLMLDMVPKRNLNNTLDRTREMEELLLKLRTMRMILEKGPQKVIEEQRLKLKFNDPWRSKKYLGSDQKDNKGPVDDELNCFKLGEERGDISRTVNFQFPPRINQNYNTTINISAANRLVTPERQQKYIPPHPATLIPTLNSYRIPTASASASSSRVIQYPQMTMSLHAPSASDPSSMRIPSTIRHPNQQFQESHLMLPIPGVQQHQQNIAPPANIHEKVYQQINIFENPQAYAHSHSLSADNGNIIHLPPQGARGSGMVARTSDDGISPDPIPRPPNPTAFLTNRNISTGNSNNYKNDLRLPSHIGNPASRPYEFLTMRHNNPAGNTKNVAANVPYLHAPLSGIRGMPYASAATSSVVSGSVSGTGSVNGSGSWCTSGRPVVALRTEALEKGDPALVGNSNSTGSGSTQPASTKSRGRGKGKGKKIGKKRISVGKIGKDELRSTSDRVQKQMIKHKSRFSVERPLHVSCLHCGDTDTPEWRRGPYGNRTLCNACGLFYRKLTKKFSVKFGNLYMRYRKIVAPHDRRVPLVIDVPTHIVRGFDDDESIDDQYFSIVPPEEERNTT